MPRRGEPSTNSWPPRGAATAPCATSRSQPRSPSRASPRSGTSTAASRRSSTTATTPRRSPRRSTMTPTSACSTSTSTSARCATRTFARLDATPDVAILGASHWQEADVGLVTDRTMYNAHVHRDYYEDPLAMNRECSSATTGCPTRSSSPSATTSSRPWPSAPTSCGLPGIPYYRRMAKEAGGSRRNHPVETAPVDTWRNRLSLGHPGDETCAAGWRRRTCPAPPTLPSPTGSTSCCRAGRSSGRTSMNNVFTQERMREEGARLRRIQEETARPMIDPKGVEASPYPARASRSPRCARLSRPPALQIPSTGTRCRATPLSRGAARSGGDRVGLGRRVRLGHGGRLRPRAPLGCTEAQYIDAEHSSRDCLKVILRSVQWRSTGPKEGLPPLDPDTPAPMPFDVPLETREEPLVAFSPQWKPANRDERLARQRRPGRRRRQGCRSGRAGGGPVAPRRPARCSPPRRCAGSSTSRSAIRGAGRHARSRSYIILPNAPGAPPIRCARRAASSTTMIFNSVRVHRDLPADRLSGLPAR